MPLYEIVLICPFCGVENRLGIISADSALEAKYTAERRWPDARYEELHARRARREEVPRPPKIVPASVLQ